MFTTNVPIDLSVMLSRDGAGDELMFTANVPIDLSVMLSRDGASVYVGGAETPVKTYTLMELTVDFLDNCCDETGKVYDECEYDLIGLLAQMKRCVKMLEDAKA